MRLMLAVFCTCAVGSAAVLLLGTTDTIGGTFHDCSVICNGIQRYVAYDPGYGVHAAWPCTQDTANRQVVDRSVRYNFRDDATGQWKWIDADYLNSGINARESWTGYGALDYDPLTHVAVIAHTHTDNSIHTDLVRGIAPGSDTFELAEWDTLSANYVWPWMAVSGTGTAHVHAMTQAYAPVYLRCSDWPSVDMDAGLFPSFDGHSQMVTASKSSGRVATLWVDGYPDYRLCVMRSWDDGLSWTPLETIPLPPAYGPDTTTNLAWANLGANFDRRDSLHAVVITLPATSDSFCWFPMGIWYYNEGNSPQWSRVAVIDLPAHHIPESTTTKLYFAQHPKIAQNPANGKLYCIWAQHDSASYDTTTRDHYLWTDVWVASSADGGYTWGAPQNVSQSPAAAEYYCDIAPIVNDTLHIVYEGDLQAGSAVEYPTSLHLTRNPIVYRRIPADAIGVAEERKPRAGAALLIWPTVTRGIVSLSGADHAPVYDRSGRRRAVLSMGRNDLAALEPGVYFVNAAGRMLKLIIAR
jgi:hypothetical protein